MKEIIKGINYSDAQAVLHKVIVGEIVDVRGYIEGWLKL
jgi:hypothetical protein